MTNRILAIDPSGTGTTGIFFIDIYDQDPNIYFTEFHQFQGKNWKEHYAFINQLVKEKEPELILYEDINFINNRNKDSLNLIRLLGAIECLSVEKVNNVNVLKVKEISKALFAGKVKIPGLEYLPGRGKGWLWQGKRISIHCLEAFLVWYLWNKLNLLKIIL